MKYILTTLLIVISLSVTAQRNNQIIKSVDDNGKRLQLTLKVRNDTTSIHFEKTFEVSGMSEVQKQSLINNIIDSLGANKYFKTTSTTTSTSSSARHSEKNLITSAVMDYVDAFYFGDTSKITRSISPDVKKWGYSRKKEDNTYVGMAMSYQQMIDYVLRVKAKNNTAEAEKLFKKVEVLDYQDQTASAKVTAWWGTDYILLGKHNGNWTITHVLWQSPPTKQ
ncbi:MAG TPA: nuclear transport factor 2 family protein [Segetibacter sp.]